MPIRRKRPAPKEPIAAERRHIRTMRHIWSVAQGIVAEGLAPLLAIWPSESEDRKDEYNPLSRRPLLPRIWNLSDAELRDLWPGIDPMEVRLYAPWATARSEVTRIAFPGGRPRGEDQIEYVRRAISAERARDPWSRNEIERIETDLRRAPGAFRLRPRSYAPVVLGADGLPVPLPPRVNVLSEAAIQRQFDWINLKLGRALQVEHLEDVIGETGKAVSRWTRREFKRVAGIDLADNPQIGRHLEIWRTHNVGLIETGLMAHDASPKLRPSMLQDLAETVGSAHREGLRVEVLAHDIAERFGVSNSRAELIARDQVLKLNGQITSQRQQSAGVTHYTWSTSDDELVRDTHRELDGTVHPWASPPEVAPGRYEHPGGDFQCRCVAIPVMPGD